MVAPTRLGVSWNILLLGPSQFSQEQLTLTSLLCLHREVAASEWSEYDAKTNITGS